MKKFFLLAVPLLAVALPTAAAAQPAGVRVEGIVGYDELRIDRDGTGPGTRQKLHGVLYGVGLGYDMPLGPNLGAGPEIEFTEATTDTVSTGATGSNFTVRRDLYVGGRLTAGLSNSLNVYGRLGYTNVVVRTQPNNAALPIDVDTLEGVRGALGLQLVDDNRAYYGVELRYSGYGDGVNRRSAALVIGARF